MKHARRLAWRSWWAIGLAIVFLMIGHDLAMALPGGAEHHEPAPAHHAREAMLGEPQPTHPTDCGVALPAVVPLASHGYLIAVPLPCNTECAPANQPLYWSDAPYWEEPAWPPGVRRALLQVYRV